VIRCRVAYSQSVPRCKHYLYVYTVRMSQIRKYRKEAGLTQKALAARLKVCESIVQKWEQGDRSPPLKRLREIARVLKQPTVNLL
jgi:transcriptional regulator with XRE-family HTH domain